MAREFVYQSPSFLLIVILVVFVILIALELFALYLRVAGFTMVEMVLMVLVPLLIYLSFLPRMINIPLDSAGATAGAVRDIVRLFDVPLFRLGNATVGVNLVGFSIPVIVSLKMLLQRRVPLKEVLLLIAIIAGVTYLYTDFRPEVGMVISLFPILPILSAAIAFMFKKMKRDSHFNPALVSYAGATVGVLIGADAVNLYRALTYQWEEPTFIALGGGGVLDAIFLAGVVALTADVVFRSQEENVLASLVRLLIGDRRK